MALCTCSVAELRDMSAGGGRHKLHDERAATPGAVLAKKRRKSRTAFTSYQLQQLERCFARHKYLLPADRDLTARRLGLTSAQLITWFQNRRAKLKRDLDELRADVDAARSMTSSTTSSTAMTSSTVGSGICPQSTT